MGFGSTYDIKETVAQDGAVTRELVRAELVAILQVDDEGVPVLNDLKEHYTLSGTYEPGHEHLIVANQPIDIRVPGKFERYRILLRDVARTAHIAFGKSASSNVGQYDDVLQGGNWVEDRCETGDLISIVVDGVPATPLEVWVYAGRYAKPL